MLPARVTHLEVEHHGADDFVGRGHLQHLGPRLTTADPKGQDCDGLPRIGESVEQTT